MFFFLLQSSLKNLAIEASRPLFQTIMAPGEVPITVRSAFCDRLREHMSPLLWSTSHDMQRVSVPGIDLGAWVDHGWPAQEVSVSDSWEADYGEAIHRLAAVGPGVILQERPPPTPVPGYIMSPCGTVLRKKAIKQEEHKGWWRIWGV